MDCHWVALGEARGTHGDDYVITDVLLRIAEAVHESPLFDLTSIEQSIVDLGAKNMDWFRRVLFLVLCKERLQELHLDFTREALADRYARVRLAFRNSQLAER